MKAFHLARAREARGFMPDDEGEALYAAASNLEIDGPLLEIGSYCGKSAIYIGAAAEEQGRLLYSVDHHRGSEENQPGWDHHDPDLVDERIGLMDTLPNFRATIYDAGLEDSVVALVGESSHIAVDWNTPLALLFIDGAHGSELARLDYVSWVPKVALGGTLLVHDVFTDPLAGGQAPYERIFLPALGSGCFEEISAVGSLRVLRCVQLSDSSV